MKEKICTFCGHRMVSTYGLEKLLEEKLVQLIEKEGFNTFYSGAMGDFDMLCQRVIWTLKRQYPHIKLCRILSRYRHNEEYSDSFGEVIFPDLEEVHYKKAITLRNRFMVDNADLLLCYVQKDYGGAYDTMQYAIKNDVPVYDLWNAQKKLKIQEILHMEEDKKEALIDAILAEVAWRIKLERILEITETDEADDAPEHVGTKGWDDVLRRAAEQEKISPQ